MQHKTPWNVPPPGSNRLRELVKPGGTNRLRELLKLYGREDVVAPVDEDAFGRRSSELVQARFGKIANASNAMNTRRKGKTSSQSSFVRLPKPSAAERARDAAAATAEYKAEELATREKTARLKKLRLEAADKRQSNCKRK